MCMVEGARVSFHSKLAKKKSKRVIKRIRNVLDFFLFESFFADETDLNLIIVDIQLVTCSRTVDNN